ncbi:MAG: hypothetical protein AAB035_01280 [Nitrospirota bacterium]
MKHKIHLKRTALFTVLAVFITVGVVVAGHPWSTYHWARTANPFSLKLGDNVSTAWDAYLTEASSDWSLSSVLDTNVIAGSSSPRTCKAKLGQVAVCNAKYGSTGWLGVASISTNSSNHITQGTVKLNDTYFNTKTYNTPAWRRLVTCQEIGHTLGLDHQDEVTTNSNLGTCMDYTNNPVGPLSNEHPNAHDYDELELIYAHSDTTTTVGQAILQGSRLNDVKGIGKGIRKDKKGRNVLHERDLGNGEKVITFIFWVD